MNVVITEVRKYFIISYESTTTVYCTTFMILRSFRTGRARLQYVYSTCSEVYV